MFNLHEAATRGVSYTVIPAAIAVLGVAAWGMRPSLLTGLTSGRALEAAEVAFQATARQKQPLVTVGEISVVVQPSAPGKPKVIHATKALSQQCDDYPMYRSGEEKVRICTWR